MKIDSWLKGLKKKVQSDDATAKNEQPKAESQDKPKQNRGADRQTGPRKRPEG